VVVIGVSTVLVSAILTIGVLFRFIKISSFQNTIGGMQGASGGSQITHLPANDFYELLSRKACWH
jgi:hypothetical protein